jgi:hypothetical protein
VTYCGDLALEQSVDVFFTTVNSSGVPTTLSGTPELAVYEANGTTEITSSETLTVDFDGRTGLNHVRITATAANGYEAGKDYTVTIITGTVGGSSVVGYVVGSFSVENRRFLTAAQVNAEVDTALADVNLDHIAGTSASIPAIPTGTYLDQIMDDGTATYDRTTDSLQAIRDRGDGFWEAEAGPTADEIGDDIAARTLTASLVDGAITAAKIATGAIDADALAADAATEIATAVRQSTLTVAAAAESTAPTLEQSLIMALAALGVFKAVRSGTTVTVYAPDTTTVLMTYTLSPTADAPTSITRET